MTLRIYVWEGDGISAAYHDDGTLVVAAESPESARALMRSEIAARAANYREAIRLRDAYIGELGAEWRSWADTDRGLGIWEMLDSCGSRSFFDGGESALDRDPDRVVELDGPKWVAFNGGGYD